MDRAKLTLPALTGALLVYIADALGRSLELIPLGVPHWDPTAGSLVSVKLEEFNQYVIPQLAKDFAAQIPAAATKCYELAALDGVDACAVQRMPRRGLCIRVVRVFDVEASRTVYHCAAAFA
jgi:hypothetical protein